MMQKVESLMKLASIRTLAFGRAQRTISRYICATNEGTSGTLSDLGSRKKTFLQKQVDQQARKQHKDATMNEACRRNPLTTVTHKQLVLNSDHLIMPTITGTLDDLNDPHGQSGIVLNYVWLRDHCRCDSCYHHTTSQRLFETNAIDLDIRPNNAALTFDPDVNDHVLHITWPDGHQSQFTYSWLTDSKNIFAGKYPKSKSVQTLWDANTIKEIDIKAVEYEKYMDKSNDESLKVLLENVLRYGYGLVHGCQTSIDDTAKTAERLCIIQNSLFGHMWSFTNDLEHSDTAYTNLALGAHNDTCYFLKGAGIQVFHLLEHTGAGGETLLVDGFKALETLRRNHKWAYDFLVETSIVHEYVEPGIDIKSLDSIINVHPITKEPIALRFNTYDRASLNTIDQEDMPKFYEANKLLANEIQNPQNEFWLKLKPGTVLFVDNWRLLHGRSAFTGRRCVCGCYLARDDWTSKARELGLVSSFHF
ncbi:unnamed protein product [Owenia fusiformis]|uniref:Trimethyllysine dioxygenase, mitochondrial n=1 Tax=Owenia fusiformis TaxID=6347 RepID=A0A8J1XNP8_OWEFU|nr:unnamed protein product [Owenia fusiformis]